ncbi:hypothetical protein [Serratia fonticola]|uniref:Morphogenetic protein n=1 Tax=Serratia fonticola TaxID=47917 RepID=A0AAW3WXE0_SERFO|nr:hypothetical protein [Serratia fonticola]MBC3214277.1 hypothetical protein [Serratia fonticola]NYA13668.1 hypothetical protein [Serratia fonticola]NYA35128.1 hypothetical protein [Serratia fonticola]
MSKERGMIFNDDMVRAIKDGRKTQTRRPVKASTSDLLDLQEKYPHKKYNIECPFGKPGDRLWVRETWQGPLVDYDDAYSMFKDPTPHQKVENCVYRADGGPCPEFTDVDDELRQGWRPSTHMPRWASRILLEITAVRVERLNAISPNDAVREGLVQLPASGRYCISQGDQYFGGASRDAREVFSWLWASIYGDESWNTNPWVWVIKFKRVPTAPKVSGS